MQTVRNISPAPIALFVYNRPEHTRKCLESILQNPLASKSSIHIFADGPKPDASERTKGYIRTTRKAIRKTSGFKQVRIYERDTNAGLATSIIEGVSQLIQEYGRVIVFEDDNILSPGCLQYLNDALDFYADEPRVMHISSFMFPVKKDLPTTFFYQPTTCSGGWATWKRAWGHLNTDAGHLLEQIEKRSDVQRFNLDGHYPFLEHLRANATGELRSWAIRWQASVFLRDGLALHPGKSLVQNAGFDGTGVHSTWHHRQIFHHKSLAANIAIKPIPIEESPEARQAMINLYDAYYHPGIFTRIVRKLMSAYFSLTRSFRPGV